MARPWKSKQRTKTKQQKQQPEHKKGPTGICCWNNDPCTNGADITGPATPLALAAGRPLELDSPGLDSLTLVASPANTGTVPRPSPLPGPPTWVQKPGGMSPHSTTTLTFRPRVIRPWIAGTRDWLPLSGDDNAPLSRSWPRRAMSHTVSCSSFGRPVGLRYQVENQNRFLPKVCAVSFTNSKTQGSQKVKNQWPHSVWSLFRLHSTVCPAAG